MKWKPAMTLSYRKRFNESRRKYYLRKQLELGRVPQPIKPASWLLSLYREYGVEDAIYIPQVWMSDEVLDEIKREQKRVRDKVRDSLPATATRKQINHAVKVMATKNVLKKFKTA